MKYSVFTFNPFQVNTYVIYDDTGEAMIIDPACSNNREQDRLTTFIEEQKLLPKGILLTHGHVDHLLGAAFVSEKYRLKIQMHKEDHFLVQQANVYAEIFSLHCPQPSEPINFLEHDMTVVFGNSKLSCIHVPGHSPGSLAFYNSASHILLCGDVLFFENIGRSDLPGGNHNRLVNSINNRLLTLPENTLVLSGHDRNTSIKHEKEHNPYLVHNN